MKCSGDEVMGDSKVCDDDSKVCDDESKGQRFHPS
jgi:hypothetical protein